MWRRLNREDLAASNPVSGLDAGRAHTFIWRVYEEYEPRDVDGDAYLLAAEASEVSRQYEPLLEAPYLFLEFARLHESKDFGQSVKDWIHKYGLLGLHRGQSQSFRESELFLHRREYSDRGGPSESFRAFGVEAFHANWALSLYEAALSEDEEKLERALHWHRRTPQDEIRQIYEFGAKEAGGTHTEVLMDIAVGHVSGLVQEVLDAFAYPYPSYSQSRHGLGTGELLHNPKSLTASLWPRNLLGAMYLQFYWLITSAGELSRCKHCNRIISHAAPVPADGNRKPRRDKEFCDSRCRQNYHYHVRVKSARQHKEGNDSS